MFDKLAELEKRYHETAGRMEDPALYADPAAYAKLAREQKELEPVVAAYAEYRRLQGEGEALKPLLADPELRETAQEELAALAARAAELETHIKMLLLPRDRDDDKNVIMEIRAGTGGEEAALFAADLYRMYAMYAEKKGWTTEIAYQNDTELGGVKEISLLISGAGAYARLKYESGVHCVKRIPATESNGRVQTSTATVAVLPEAADVDFALDMNDLRIDTYRSSGAGGQKVNKTSSAIRVTHIPTGTVVACQDERSQYKNKDRALSILRSKLYEAERSKRDAAVAAERRSQVGSGSRSERIRTYFILRSQVVDHRLSGSARSFNSETLLNGALDELIDALTLADQTEKLRAAGDEA